MLEIMDTAGTEQFSRSIPVLKLSTVEMGIESSADECRCN